jgi:Holliday junction resolvasome RuvABC endonuclease subunit
VPGCLALDLGTNLGWTMGSFLARPLTLIEAATIKPKQPLSGAHRIAPPGTPVGRFLSLYADWLQKMIETHRPLGLAFESPILPKATSAQTVRKLMSLAGVTEMMGFDYGIRWIREAQPSSVKLHISGNGGPGKENVQNAIIARGWTFSTPDEADSLAVWDWAAHQYARERQAA